MNSLFKNAINRSGFKLNLSSIRLFATKDIYVGNIAFSATQQDIESIFKEEMNQGMIEAVRVPVDRFSGQSRGFAFLVTKEENIDDVVSKYDGSDFKGRFLRVRYAEAKKLGEHQ